MSNDKIELLTRLIKIGNITLSEAIVLMEEPVSWKSEKPLKPEELAKQIIDRSNEWGMYSIADEIYKIVRHHEITGEY